MICRLTKAMGKMDKWYEKVMALGNNNFRSVIKTFRNHAPLYETSGISENKECVGFYPCCRPCIVLHFSWEITLYGVRRSGRVRSAQRTPVVHRGDTGVLLEIPAEKRLVRELQPVRYFLYAQLRRLEQGFDFEDNMAVDDVLDRGAGYVLHDGRQVARGYEQFGGIERDFPLGHAMGVYQPDEVFEEFFLAVRAVGLLL